MNTYTFSRTLVLIFLSYCIFAHAGMTQIVENARVISGGGGISSSSSSQYEHFGVIGEAIVTSQMSNNALEGKAGYIFMTIPIEPYYISRNDSLILVDMYNAMGGENWTTSWNLEEPVINWVGVEVALGSVLSVDLTENNLTGTMPTSVRNFTRINEEEFTIRIGDNRLNFASAEPFVNLIDIFEYSPQAEIYSSLDTTVQEGASLVFTSQTPGTFNQYQWYKDGEALIGATEPTLEIENVIVEDAGIYTCQITNTVATELTLVRRDIKLNVEGFLEPLDSLALVQIFESTQGNNWIRPWNLEDPVSTWEGVSLEGNRVVEIDLSSRNLTGQIADVFDADIFSDLRYLNLFDNQLEGQIPETLGEAINLTYLDLDKNNFSGEVPASLGNLVNLTALWLSRNDFTGLPDEIGNLSSLQGLYLNDNNFSVLPETISNLSELLVLNVNDNELTALPEGVTNLRKLRELYANRNDISTIPSNMNVLSALAIFEINTNELLNLPASLAQIASLRTLKVAENSLEFDDLLPFVTMNSFEYSPQTPVGEERDFLVELGATISLEVNSQANGNIYRWELDGAFIGSSPELVINNVQNQDAGTYIAFITNPALPDLVLERRPISINVECADFELVISTPEQTTFCSGQPFGAQLRIQSQIAGNARIRWRRDDVIIAFANERSYTVTTVGNYTAELVTAGGCTALSNEVKINVVEQPEVSIELIENTTFISSVSIEGTYGYQWLRNGEIIVGANLPTYQPSESGSYSLSIISEQGCSSTSSAIPFTITSLEEEPVEEPLAFKEITLYPNPNDGTFYFDFGRVPFGEPRFRLIDAIGRKTNIKTHQVSSTRFAMNLGQVPGGLYHIEVETSEGLAVRKFIVEE